MSRHLVLGLLLSAAVARGEEKKPPVPLYTNADLERVAPTRGETGVLSTSTPAERPAPPRSEPARAGRGEEYWRAQAERLRDRLEPMQEKVRELRLRIEERQRQPGVRPYTDAQVQAGQRRLQALEARIRDLESRFEERARREGALPGWLR